MENKRLSHLLRKKTSDKIPIWFMRQAGRHLPEYLKLRSEFKDFISFTLNPQAVVEATLQPLKRYDIDAAIIFSDILIIPMMFDQKVSFIKGQGPVLGDIDINKIKKFDLSVAQPIYDAIAMTRQCMPFDKDLIAFAGAPWTLATYMIEKGSSKDFSTTRSFAYQHTLQFTNLLNLLTDAITQHLIKQAEAGATVLKVFDSWASSVPAHKFIEWVVIPHQKIRENLLKACPSIPVIFFPKGLSDEKIALYQKYVNADAVALSYTNDWAALCQKEKTLFQGNLDPAQLRAGGQSMIDQVRFICQKSSRPFIFNLGHGVLPDTPIDHVHQVIQSVREFS